MKDEMTIVIIIENIFAMLDNSIYYIYIEFNSPWRIAQLDIYILGDVKK